MNEILLIKTGELALKGLNRGAFEDVLIKNLHRALRDTGELRITKAQSTIYIEPASPKAYDFDEAERKIEKVFGIAAFARAAVFEKNMAELLASAAAYLAPVLEQAESFKVEAKRADKTFPVQSPEICAEIGGMLVESFPHLRVDVNTPDVTVTVEIRERGAYIHAGKRTGAGGLPAGTGGNAAVLLSGGIDSPVAAWMLAKRGLSLTAVHFASPPHTGERAEMKVRDLASKVAEYAGGIRLFTVFFTEIQRQIAEKCPEDLATVLGRRFMMRIASRIAREHSCAALITGESVGQVASQTLPALVCTDAVCDLPVLRPLIGMDKEEIIRIARRIGTFDISVLPYDDCCAIFTPKHPRIRPTLDMVLAAEEKLDVEALLDAALARVKNVSV